MDDFRGFDISNWTFANAILHRVNFVKSDFLNEHTLLQPTTATKQAREQQPRCWSHRMLEGKGRHLARRIRDSWRQTEKNANRMRGALVKYAILAKCSGHRPMLISCTYQIFLLLTLNRLCLTIYSLEVTVGAIFCDINKLLIFPRKNLNYKHRLFFHTTLTGLYTTDDRSSPWGVTCTFTYNLDQRQSTND